MKAKEFIERFSVKTRVLSGFCSGTVVHVVKGGDRYYGGVIRDQDAYLIPMQRHQAEHFLWSVGAEIENAIIDAMIEDCAA